MNAKERYNSYFGEPLDDIMQHIKYNRIKCGKYAHLVKVDKDKIIKDKELFTNGSREKSDECKKKSK